MSEKCHYKEAEGQELFFFSANHFSKPEPPTHREHRTTTRNGRQNTKQPQQGIHREAVPGGGRPPGTAGEGVPTTISRRVQSGRMIDLQYDRGREQEGERYLWDARAGVQKPVNSRVRVRALGLRWHVSGYATVVSDQVAAVHARPFK